MQQISLMNRNLLTVETIIHIRINFELPQNFGRKSGEVLYESCAYSAKNS